MSVHTACQPPSKKRKLLPDTITEELYDTLEHPEAINEQPESPKVSKEDPDFYNKVYAALNIHGVCVIPDMYTQEECDRANKAFIDEFASKINPTMSSPAQFQFRKFLTGSIHGMYQSGSTQTKGTWWFRQHEATVQVFAETYSRARQKRISYKPTDMLVSMDAVCYREPNVRTTNVKEWYHLDQTKGSPFDSIQGMAVLKPQPKDGPCLRVSRGAHKAALEFVTTETKKLTGFYRLDNDALDRITALAPDTIYPRFHVDAPRGSLVLWQSCLPHMGGQGSATVTDSAGRTLLIEPDGRHVIYVAYQPREFIRKSATKHLQKRISVFEASRNTTHESATRCVQFGKTPAHFHPPTASQYDIAFFKDPTKVLDVMTKDALTPLGRKLVGYDS